MDQLVRLAQEGLVDCPDQWDLRALAVQRALKDLEDLRVLAGLWDQMDQAVLTGQEVHQGPLEF